MQRGAKTEAVVEWVRSRIAGRTLPPEENLPSIRRMAAKMGVSPSTVVEAYDRLAAEGLIHSRPGSGFFVSDRTEPLALSEIEPKRLRDIDPLWVSRQSLDAPAEALKPGCGWMPPDWMPHAAVRKALRALARADDALLSDYGSASGADGLRRLLARRLAEESLPIDPGQVLLTGSGTQAIDLICRLFLKPGDAVLVDDPCYFNFQALLKAHRAKIVGVRYTENGPDPNLFREEAARERPRLYITNSALHNPTGATMTPKVAHSVLGIAAEHDIVIVEDDIFADFEPEPSSRFAALDGLNRVIRIGSFSKTLSAAIRCGHIAAHPDWIEALVDLQVATNFGGPSPVSVEVLRTALRDGGYRKHMDALRRRLAKARRDVAARLAEADIAPWLMPRGGFYLWCELPDELDATVVAHAAFEEGLILAPGNVFSPSQSMTGYMRFNVSQMLDPPVLHRLERIMTTLRE